MRESGKRDALTNMHPTISLLYFALVLVFSMLLMHPLCIALSLLCAFSYALVHRGFKSLIVVVPLLLVTAVVNPLVSHAGVTILAYLPSGNPLTLESILYGIAAACMLVSAILWFFSFNAVMRSDKLVFLFGRIAPALSLMFSMTLRFVPQLRAQSRVIADAQRGIGRGGGQGGLCPRIRHGVHILSILLTWALENAIETADSMKSRGYGLPGRTAFSLFRFEKRDRRTLVFLLVCGGTIAVGALRGGFQFRYYPAVSGVGVGWVSVSLFAAYFALCALPLVLHGKEVRAWQKSKAAQA
ncbi:MAG: energy-coupling factor transporter transmembrane protein EcfT [Oscillospiraceae bacterium]|jgi:energy-coupling factor transport system permease protein|nr:energy-coupling factor transporter transmembrane protein EcfT [Oscillospiraceae bacterium]